MISIEKKYVKRILIIKLRGIGDVVLSTIVIKNLLKDFPGAEIDYLTEKASKDAVEKLPGINNVLLFNRKSLKKKVVLVFEIRKRKYDLVFDFFSNPTTAQITFLSGAKYRAGFPYRGRKYAYNIFGPSDRGTYHSAELHLLTLKNAGLYAEYNDLLFTLTDEDKAVADNFIKENNLTAKPIIGICPSGGWQSKKCPAEKFTELVKIISDVYDVNFLILWGPGDFEDASFIHNAVPENSYIIPKTSIRQMGAFMCKCTMLIANDSGPMHISAALGVPTIALFGPTNPLLQGPYGEKNNYIRAEKLNCIGCDLLECPKEQDCFTSITGEMIIDAVNSTISKNNLVIKNKNE